MHLRSWLVICVIGAVGLTRAEGLPFREETQKVPLGRLFANLEKRLKQNTNDFQAAYGLARLHAMAYATNVTEVDATKEDKPVFGYQLSDSGIPRAVPFFSSAEARRNGRAHLTNAIALYDRAIVLLKNPTNFNEHQWLVLPLELGRAWCLDQAGDRQKAIDAYRRTLKLAWKIEVTGSFDMQQWVKDVWNDVRSGTNPVHGRNRGSLGPGVCFSEETIGYLLKLLDPVIDADEIARLKADKKTLAAMGRAVSPILVGLDPAATFQDLVDPCAAVTFDLDGSGLPRKWGWITPKAAWLVYDSDGTGCISSALQMFGAVTFWIFWQDGYCALESLDEDGDRMLRGSELEGLALWQDNNQDGICDLGEVRSVQSLGIIAISCRSSAHETGIQWNRAGVTFTNGSSLATYDWLAPAR